MEIVMATAKNDITGDWIKSKPASDMFEQNFDRIFRQKKVEEKLEESIKDNEELYKSVSRIEQIGQNGNDGIHYEYELDKSTGEVIKKDGN